MAANTVERVTPAAPAAALLFEHAVGGFGEERRGEHQASPFRHLSVGRVLVWLHARRRPDAPGHLSVACH